MATNVRKAIPARVRRTNRVVTVLLRLGVPVGPMALLTVPGRRSGLPRTTPVATFKFEGKRYMMQGFPGAAWVENARAAGSGLLGRGPRRRRVRLVEVPVEERRAILRHAGGIAPASLARTFVENGLIASPDADAFAVSAPTTAVFRVDAAR